MKRYRAEIYKIIEKQMNERQELLEAICKLANEKQLGGVTVISGNWSGGYQVRLDVNVPIGSIFEFPDEAAYQAWEDNGRPT